MATESPIVPHHARWSLPADFQFQTKIRSLSSQSQSKPQLDISIPELPLFVQARSHALAEPHKPAIIDKTRNQSFTYSELLNDVAVFKAQIEQFLQPSPVGEEPRVAFLTPSGYDYVVMQWAIWASGAISVPLCRLISRHRATLSQRIIYSQLTHPYRHVPPTQGATIHHIRLRPVINHPPPIIL